jgi:dGTPase
LSQSWNDLRRDRRTVEKKKAEDNREPAERDYDRILYSSALRRLGGVTQVVAAHEGHVFHNRLTHSLRVAQLARRLAQKLLKDDLNTARDVGGISPDVTEAAGLAHDLGHPPFGHIGEETLSACVAEDRHVWDGFEGNAQSFRIVTKLALSSPQIPGLNLTRATLNAVLKYPWARQSDGPRKKKYGIYQSEQEDLEFARQLQPIAGDTRKSAEAEIMDWADDITYAVHDAEDFYRARLIPLDRLGSLNDESERKRFFDGMYERPELKKIMGEEPRRELEQTFLRFITAFPISEPYTGTREQRSRLRWISSILIGQFVRAIDLQKPSDKNQAFVKILRPQKLEVRMLKALTWFYVIYNPSLATQQYGQRKIIRELFNIFGNAAISANDEERNIIPFAFREQLLEAENNNDAVVRVVADIIANMTEQGLVKLYRRLTGIDMGSILDYGHGN